MTGQSRSVVSKGDRVNISDTTEEPEVKQQSGQQHESLQSELEEEASQNGDIVQGLFIDSYRSVSRWFIQGHNFALKSG